MLHSMLCRLCHNTTDFLAVGQVEVDLRTEQQENDFHRNVKDFVTQAQIKCVSCMTQGNDTLITYYEARAPRMTITPHPEDQGTTLPAMGLYHSPEGYHYGLLGSHEHIGVEYKAGKRGVTESPTEDNIRESVVDWAMTVIRDTCLPLAEFGNHGKSVFYIGLHNFQVLEWVNLLDRCAEEGIGQTNHAPMANITQS